MDGVACRDYTKYFEAIVGSSARAWSAIIVCDL